MTSDIRTLVLEALEANPNGLTRDEVALWVTPNDQAPNYRSVGACLGRCSVDRLVEERHGRFHLVSQKAEPATKSNTGRLGIKVFGATPVNHNQSPAMLPEIARHREGKRVSHYTLPDEYEGVLQVRLCVQGTWVKVPMFGSIRLCIANGVPQWCAEQETNQGVSLVRLILAANEQIDIPVGAGQLVTIAPEED